MSNEEEETDSAHRTAVAAWQDELCELVERGAHTVGMDCVIESQIAALTRTIAAACQNSNPVVCLGCLARLGHLIALSFRAIAEDERKEREEALPPGLRPS